MSSKDTDLLCDSAENKYLKLKSEYLYLKSKSGKSSINMEGGKKKCEISRTDKIFFGEGGSSAIVIITESKKVYKVFIQYEWKEDIDIKIKKKIKERNIENEINIYRELTKNIIKPGISAHYVKYVGDHICSGAKELFKDCPKSYSEFMKIAKDKKNKMCERYFRGHPTAKVVSKYRVIEIEHCDYSCADYIKDISKLPGIEMEKYLDILFFQITYTIVATQDKYPYFTHNDLFIRNILGKREKDNGNYYTYNLNEMVFYVPKKKFYPKISDFGFSNLNGNNKNIELYKSDYRDVYNFMLDVYDGANLGSQSLLSLCKDDPDKIDFIKKYFSNFFNTNIVDEFKKNSPQHMDWNWSNILDGDFLQSIGLVNPRDLLKNYFYDIFNKIYTNYDLRK